MLFARGKAPLYLSILVLLTALAYLPGLKGGWIFDDDSNIVREKAVQAESVDAALFEKAAEGFNHGTGRPLAMISFALDHVVWGKDPWGYKLTSLLVHILNALLVFAVVRRLLALARPERDTSVAAAFAVAAIWALHPLQVSTVHYVVQRMEMLSLTFVLIALIAYLKARRLQAEGQRGWPWLLACLPLVGAGLLCKETAALFPAYTLALELTVLGFGAASVTTTHRWRAAYLLGVVAAVAALILLVYPRYSPAYAWEFRNFDMAERLLTQLRVLPMYLGWIVIPQPASYDFYYDNFAPSHGWLDPWTTLAGAILIAGLLAVAFAARRRMPLLSLGLLWFFAAHALTSSIIPLELVFEHRNYFAILGIALVGADLYFRLPASEIPRIRPFAVGVVIVGLFGLTLIRSASWGQPLTLAMTLAEQNPGSSRASMDLGEQYMLRAHRDPASKYYAMAVQEFERGSRVPDASPMPEQGLIVLAASAGVTANPEWWDRVVYKLENRPIGPQEVSMIVGLLRKRREGLLIDDRRFAESYLVLANRSRMPPQQFFAFGEHALEYLGDNRVAEQLFVRAVEYSVGQPELVAAMVDALIGKGQRSIAIAVADRARELDIADVKIPEALAVPAGPVVDNADNAAAEAVAPAPPATN